MDFFYILYFLCSLWNVFVDAACHSDNPDAAIIQAISELPLPNRDTLAYLMIHFQTVAENHTVNKMGKNKTIHIYDIFIVTAIMVLSDP